MRDVPDALSGHLQGYWLRISIADQQLQLLRSDKVLHSWRVSTASAGAGCAQDSLCTPWGWHSVAQKFGDGEPSGRCFSAREPTDQVVEPEQANDYQGVDLILTRILWLQGEEEGLNKGPGRDSKARYIYIHGTHEEDRIGTPASHGCIRMRSADIVEMYPQVETGAAVLIERE